MNDAMTSKRTRRQQELVEKAAIAISNSQKDLRTEIEILTTTLQKQKVEHDAALVNTK